jgi:hypothetical protein
MAVTLFEARAGLDQLRIQPVNASADGEYLFCLGSDLSVPPPEDYLIGDKVSVEQTVELDGTKLLQIQARFRQPASLPERVDLVGATLTEYSRSGVNNTTVLKAASPVFTSAHNHREVYLSGSGITPGTYRIQVGGMDYNTTETTYEADSGAAVLFGNDPGAGTDTPVTGYLKGAYWRAKVIYDGDTIFSFNPGSDGQGERDLLLPNLTVNVTGDTGSKVIKYEFELVEAGGIVLPDLITLADEVAAVKL